MTFSHEEKTGKYYEILDVCKKKKYSNYVNLVRWQKSSTLL